MGTLTLVMHWMCTKDTSLPKGDLGRDPNDITPPLREVRKCSYIYVHFSISKHTMCTLVHTTTPIGTLQTYTNLSSVFKGLGKTTARPENSLVSSTDHNTCMAYLPQWPSRPSDCPHQPPTAFHLTAVECLTRNTQMACLQHAATSDQQGGRHRWQRSSLIHLSLQWQGAHHQPHIQLNNCMVHLVAFSR